LFFYSAVLVGVLNKLNKTLPNFGQKRKSLLLLTNLLEQLARWRNIRHGEFGVNYDFNYKRGLFGIINLSYSLSKIKGDNKTAKTDDRLELNSIWGKKQGWFY
jgi:hypothetical protein